MKLMEELFKDNKIKECSSLKELMESYSEAHGPLFTKILHEFHIHLGCGYTLWEGHCYTCVPIEITLLEIMHRDEVWLYVGRGFFVSKIIKFGYLNNIVYFIDAICGQVFHNISCL